MSSRSAVVEVATTPAGPGSGYAKPGATRSQIAARIDRYLAPVLITAILLAGQLTYGILESYTRTLLAIATAIAMEMVLGRLVTKKWPYLASAYISGISVGILIRSPAFWPYALCAAISIVSKYAIRVEGRHIWNPSNFGVSSMLFLAPFAVAPLSIQWGNNHWPLYIIWVLGSIIIGRLHRFHICLTYVASFFLFAAIRQRLIGQSFKTEIAPITSAPYQLFIFFMITDPKTTVRSKWGQCLTAIAVAGAECLFRLGESIHAPYYALFCVGPAANLIEMALKGWPRRSSAGAGRTMGEDVPAGQGNRVSTQHRLVPSPGTPGEG